MLLIALIAFDKIFTALKSFEIIMSETIDDNSVASDPGMIRLSHEKMCAFHPELYEFKGWCNKIKKKFTDEQRFWQTRHREHLGTGDSRAAIVVLLRPLLVAAYSDEFDCVSMLEFSQRLVSTYGLTVGTRLLTVNIYWPEGVLAGDLSNGPASFNRYFNFSPLIAEFLSFDSDRIEQRKAEISGQEWDRTLELGQVYLERHGTSARDGRPMYCSIPAIH
jgi:hypothetical protein